MSGETFESLLAPHLRYVQKVVRSRLRASGHVEDVVQQVLMRAFVRRDQLRVQDKFKSWLLSIAMNEIRMYFRRDRGDVSLEELPNFDARDPSISPLERLEQRETSNWLRSSIAELSERDQATIRLCDIDGKTVREAAALLDSTEAATKIAHFRARKRLAILMRTQAA